MLLYSRKGGTMKDWLKVQLEKLRNKLEEDMLFLLNKFFDVDIEDREQIAERFSVLSGISVERLLEIKSYVMDRMPSSSMQLEKDNWLDESKSDTESLRLSIQEIHSLCNAISFSLSPIQNSNADSIEDNIVDRSDSIIQRWVDTVNEYYEHSNRIFEELVDASCTETTEKFFAEYHIFLDASALCDEGMGEMLNSLVCEIKKATKPLKITVPKSVVDCLQDVVQDEEKNLLFGADEGLKNLKYIQKEDLLSVRGDSADTTVMSTFLSAFSRFKPTYKMVLITQDELLANAVQMLNTSGVEGDEILISKVTDDITLSLWFNNESSNVDEDVDENENSDQDSTETQIAPVFTEESEMEKLKDSDPADDDISCEEDSATESERYAASDEAESAPDDISDFPSETELTGSMSEDDYGFDTEDGQRDQAAINEVETDAEKMAMLEEQLANMLGQKKTLESDDDEEDDDDEDASESEEKAGDEDRALSENDTLIADAFESDSWSVLD